MEPVAGAPARGYPPDPYAQAGGVQPQYPAQQAYPQQPAYPGEVYGPFYPGDPRYIVVQPAGPNVYAAVDPTPRRPWWLPKRRAVVVRNAPIPPADIPNGTYFATW
jgi:hypothetical protein